MLKGKITITNEQPFPQQKQSTNVNKKKLNKKIKKLKIKPNQKSGLEIIDEQQQYQQKPKAQQQSEQQISNQHDIVHNITIPQKSKLKNLAICFPDSILQIPQSSVLRSYFISQIARISSIFKVDQLIILKDQGIQTKSQNFSYSQYLARNLQYLQTPQYLRKHLFKMHPDLKNAGLMNPIECHHHLKNQDICEFRDGVSLDRPTKQSAGSWVDIGLKQQARMNYTILPNTRVTLRLKNYQNKNANFYQAEAVSKKTPQLQKNLYWGYNVRIANNFNQIFENKQKYDIKILCNHQQIIEELPNIKNFNNIQLNSKSVLIFLSGIDNINTLLLRNKKQSINIQQIYKQFNYSFIYQNVGVQKLRMEQQLFIILCQLSNIIA